AARDGRLRRAAPRERRARPAPLRGRRRSRAAPPTPPAGPGADRAASSRFPPAISWSRSAGRALAALPSPRRLPALGVSAMIAPGRGPPQGSLCPGMSIVHLLAEQMTVPDDVEAGRRPYRMFVRDLVLPCSIGVYPHEHLAKQRIKINVDLLVLENPGPRN